MANYLTAARILCGVLILFCPMFSGRFYVLYLIGGLTDAIDGTVARMTGTASDFGAKLDTVADLVFIPAVIVKLIAALSVPLWFLVWVGGIICLKLTGLVLGFVRYRHFPAVHSKLNKLCGAVVFLIPFFLSASYAWQARAFVVVAACLLASVAAVQEFIYIMQGKQVA